MVVDIFEFVRCFHRASGAIAPSELTRLDLANFLGEVDWKAQGIHDGKEQQRLHVEIAGVIHLICQRCLEPMEYTIRLENRYRLVPTQQQAEQAPLNDDECDTVLGSKQFDIHHLIEDELLLSLPAIPKHGNCLLIPVTTNDSTD